MKGPTAEEYLYRTRSIYHADHRHDRWRSGLLPRSMPLSPFQQNCEGFADPVFLQFEKQRRFLEFLRREFTSSKTEAEKEVVFSMLCKG